MMIGTRAPARSAWRMRWVAAYPSSLGMATSMRISSGSPVRASTRQATINVAEGDKQSAILRAEGGRQSQILQAEGYANALKTIFGAAQGIDQKTMALQYLDAIKVLGAGESTKWVIPMELAELTRPITDAMRTTRASEGPG